MAVAVEDEPADAGLPSAGWQEPTSSHGWQSIHNKLTADQASDQKVLDLLQSQIQDLSLKASMGDQSAYALIQQLEKQAEERQLKIDLSRSALIPVGRGLAAAQRTEAAVAEELRRLTLGKDLLQLKREALEPIERCLEELAGHFKKRDAILGPLLSLMSGNERPTFDNLLKQRFYVFSACAVGLHKYLDLGPLSGHPADWRPLSYFVAQIIGSYGWLGEAEAEAASDRVIEKE